MTEEALPRPSPYAWPTGWRKDWRYEELRHKLLSHHTPERVQAIILGADPATNEDLAKWRGLGRR